MYESLTILVPSAWCTGEPDEFHDPRVQAIITCIELHLTIQDEHGSWGWLWCDYGASEVGDPATTELCFDMVWRGPGKDPRYVGVEHGTQIQ
jgi:hypothetical protein